MKPEMKPEIKLINQILIIVSMFFVCMLFLGIGYVLGSANFDKYKFCVNYMFDKN